MYVRTYACTCERRGERDGGGSHLPVGELSVQRAVLEEQRLREGFPRRCMCKKPCWC